MKITYNPASVLCDVCSANRDMPGLLSIPGAVPLFEREVHLDDAAPCVAMCKECADRTEGAVN